VGLWQKIRGVFIRDDEPGEDEVDASSVQYPKVELDERGADEAADEPEQGEGFR
jgi:hypothetical protein